MRIAITGSIGSGKSEVGKILIQMGYSVINTDTLVAQLLERGTDVYGLLVETYGEKILDADRNVNKLTLADMIFNDPIEKKRIEGWMHPLIWKRVEDQCAANKGEKPIFVEVPLLFETDSQYRFDRNILILTDQEIAIERLMIHRKMNRAEARRRWESQMDPLLKMELADDILFNDGNLNDLYVSIEEYLKKLETLR